ncbi:MAG: argininosuccinate lyase, partial [Pseudomonadota bacterium]
PVFDASDALALALAAMEGMVRDMAPNRPVLEAAAGAGYATATDLADWMVRELGLPFRDAHHVTGRIVAAAEAAGLALDAMSLSALQAIEPRLDERVMGVLSPSASAGSRLSYGGTAPTRVREQVARWRTALAEEGGP